MNSIAWEFSNLQNPLPSIYLKSFRESGAGIQINRDSLQEKDTVGESNQYWHHY